MTSATIDGGNRPCSTTPGIARTQRPALPDPRRAQVIHDRRCRPANPRRPRRRHGPSDPGSRGAWPPAEPHHLERDRRADGLDQLVRGHDHDEPFGRGRHDLLARLRAVPPLTSHRSGAPGPPRRPPGPAARSCRTPTTSRPSARAAASVSGEVETHVTVAARRASAGRKNATVLPVPRPTVMPSRTSSAAASAAARFSSALGSAAFGSIVATDAIRLRTAARPKACPAMPKPSPRNTTCRRGPRRGAPPVASSSAPSAWLCSPPRARFERRSSPRPPRRRRRRRPRPGRRPCGFPERPGQRRDADLA